MTDYDPGPPPSPWVKWLKAAVCLAVVSLLAAGFWLRWIPGRPVPSEWARGGASPDNSLSYQTEDDLPSSVAGDVEAVSSANFVFTMGEGGGLHGYDVIQVWPDGRCQYTYPDPGPTGNSPAATHPATAPGASPADLAPFRRATFRVSPRVVADLRRLLVDIDYFNLKKAYRAPPSAAAPSPSASAPPGDGAPPDTAAPFDNGTQWFVRVHAGSHEKAVWCDNHFPRQIMKLNDFVRTEIVEPNTTARSLAGPVNLPRNWLPDFGIPRIAPDVEPAGD